MDVHVTLHVNGVQADADVEPRLTLADLLRDELRLTGTHLGCEHGVCGSCTVLLDGVPIRSCLMLAVQAEGASITTVEGLADGDGLHRLQQAFHEAGGLQCGYCTPGLLMAALPLCDGGGPVSMEEIYEAIGGNLCRCTGYAAIVDAIARATGSTTG